MNYGCIGGAHHDLTHEWFETADIAAQVLSGERRENIPIVHDRTLQILVGWRALRYWHIRESALPAGSLIVNRPPSLWESYRKYFIAAIVITSVLLLLIIGCCGSG